MEPFVTLTNSDMTNNGRTSIRAIDRTTEMDNIRVMRARFYDRITRKNLIDNDGDIIEQANDLLAKPNLGDEYIGGFVIRAKDLEKIMHITINEDSVAGLLIQFGYQNTNNGKDETHLFIQKIITDEDGVYADGLFSTIKPNAGGNPDPTFHCPGPAGCPE